MLGFEPSRTRTCDPLVKSQLLYRLSYRPIYKQRAREGVLFRGTSEGILLNARGIVQNESQILITEPAAERGVVHDDRLRAFGAGRDEADLDTNLFGKEVDVATRVCRQ